MNRADIASVDDPIFENSSVTSALSRVKHCLNYALKEQFGVEDPEITEKFMKMHGLSKQHFDFISNFENLIEKGIADNSVDTNANKGDTSITGLLSETSQPINKLVGYRYLYRKMKELYGKKRAKFLAGEMYAMNLALADSTNVLKPYCYSINASKLVIEGKPWGTLFSAPPKRVVSYINQLSELIHQLSCHVAGAIAVGSFFMDLAHVYIYREGKTLTELKEDSNTRKTMENCLQSFVHSMNHLSRNSVESPFTNISIFDRAKLRSLIGPDNMEWYFEKEDPIDGTPQAALNDCKEDWAEYIIDVIMEFQEIYMNIMDNGDPLHDHKPITFPVSTINISRQKNRLGNYEFADRAFADYVCKNHDIMRYNIYISDGTKVSSCCRLLSSMEMLDLGGQVNSFGGTALSLGSHRVVTINLRRISLICKSWEDYKNILFEKMSNAADILKAHKELIKDLEARGTQPFITNGWLDLDRMFSTFGIMGYYEAAQDAKKRFGGDFDYIGDLIQTIDTYAKDLTKSKGLIFNVEEIPGETMAVKLANTDRWIFGEDKVSEPLYANQFIPLWVDATLHEKLHEEGRLCKMLTGGGICHYSLGEKITGAQARNVIEEMLKEGCEHAALNPVYSICENDHYTFGKATTCPKCGKPITDHLTRTVGFFVKTSNMTTTKREDDFKKRNYKSI